MLWVYTMGVLAAIATTLDPHAILYQNTMDSLNQFMRDRKVAAPSRLQPVGRGHRARRVQLAGVLRIARPRRACR